MIKFQCDICKKETIKLETIVLYKKTINYCDKCMKKAYKLKCDVQKELNYKNFMFDNYMTHKEKEILKEVQKKWRQEKI